MNKHTVVSCRCGLDCPCTLELDTGIDGAWLSLDRNKTVLNIKLDRYGLERLRTGINEILEDVE